MMLCMAVVSGPLQRRPIVAIDGPAGAGKSTVARLLADALGFVLVDTGALYRAVALAARRVGIEWADEVAVGDLSRSLVARSALSFERASDQGFRIRLDGEDVSGAIRAPEMGTAASTVSAHAPVRDALLEMQRQAGREGGVVLEGRDIGTVVFPKAEVKFFLTARPEVRARRRFDELTAKGAKVTYEEVLEDVLSRDERDTMRPVAPSAAGRRCRARRQLGHLDRRDGGAHGERGARQAGGMSRKTEPRRSLGVSLRSLTAPALCATFLGAALSACGSKPPHVAVHKHVDEPRWEDVFDTMPELFVDVRPRALRQDTVYGPLLGRALDLVRQKSHVVAALQALDALQNAEDIVIGIRPDTQDRPPELVMVARGVPADMDPVKMVGAEGAPLWAAGPSGGVPEFVRIIGATEKADPSSLFELPGRTWVIASGNAQARARDAFAHPFNRPRFDFDPDALALARLDGSSFVQRMPPLQAHGGLSAVGRHLQSVTVVLLPGAEGAVRATLAYTDDDAAALAEVAARQAVEAVVRSKRASFAWMGTLTVGRDQKHVILAAPFPPQLIDALMHAGTAPLEDIAPSAP